MFRFIVFVLALISGNGVTHVRTTADIIWPDDPHIPQPDDILWCD